MIQWGLIVALISIVVIGLLKLTISEHIKNNFSTINDAINIESKIENIEEESTPEDNEE